MANGDRVKDGSGDFKALRAKFQNDFNVSGALLQPAKKPSAEITLQQNSSNISTARHAPFCRVQVPGPEKKAEWFSYTSQKSEILRIKPVALPRIRLGEARKNEDTKNKDIPRTLGEETASVVETQKQCPTSRLYPPEAESSNSSFLNTLHIWESTSSQNNQRNSVLPPQCAKRTTSLAHSRNANNAITVEDNAKTAGHEQALISAVLKNSPHLHNKPVAFPAISPPVLPRGRTSFLPSSEPLPFPTTSPPAPPRGRVRLERITQEGIKATDFSTDAYDFDRPNQVFQYSYERQHVVEKNKLPKTKPLPPIVSLGPPPKKPPRPPKVDLGKFQQKYRDVVDEEYMTPEITGTGELGAYEETISYLKQSENSMNLCAIQEAAHSSRAGKKEDIEKQRFLTAAPDTETGNVRGREPHWDDEAPKQRPPKEIIKTSGHGVIFAKANISGEKVWKNIPSEEATQSFPGTWLAKDGNNGYVCLEALKIDEEKTTQCPRTPKAEHCVEEVYDDVEETERGFEASDTTYSSFMSDTFSESTYEETYEDVQSGDCNSNKLDNEKIEKLKRFGNLFKKEKFKMKNAQLKENFRAVKESLERQLKQDIINKEDGVWLSNEWLPALEPLKDVMAQENMVYDNIGIQHNDTKERHKNWKLKFHISKEDRRSSEDGEILSSRNFFKVKKCNVDKMTKEEKLFRETFMYNKEITVINTAVAHCSNTWTKKKLDLRITAGEQVDIIDIAEGNQLICRNSEGKYGYVSLEHLNFRH